MWRLAWIVLGGCTTVLDLAPTNIGTDTDGDGVFDQDDNCPDVPNPEQDPEACAFCRIGVDLDRDGIDDGCDVCPRGRNDEDEDGDGIANACDACPATAGAATDPDTDGDGIGDACDRSVSVERRDFFDGFDQDLPAWSSSDPWVETGGTRASSHDTLELYWVRVDGTDASWSVTTGIVLPVAAPSNQATFVGLDLFDETRVFPVSCGFGLDVTGWHLMINETISGTSPFGAVAFAPGQHVDLRVYATHAGNIGAPVIHCEANGDAVTYTPTYEARRGIALRSTTSTTYTYVDLILHAR